MLSRISLALFTALVSLAAYAGGTAGLLFSYGVTTPPPPTINITDQTVGDGDNEGVGVAFEVNISGLCGNGCMETGDNSVFTPVASEWAVNWETAGYPSCFGQFYEILWHQVSGTLEQPPFGSSETLPADTWSKTEWGDALALCDANWTIGFFTGPIFGQGAAQPDTVITISIREIANPSNNDTATYTLTP